MARMHSISSVVNFDPKDDKRNELRGKLGYGPHYREHMRKLGTKYGLQGAPMSTVPGKMDNNDGPDNAWAAYENRVMNAVENDYDVRRSMELAEETGTAKEHFGKLHKKGIASLGDAMTVHDSMAKVYGDQLGGDPEEYGESKDQMAVTRYFNEQLQDKRNKDLDARFASMQPSSPEDDGSTEENQQPREMSGRLQEARERVRNFEAAGGANTGGAEAPDAQGQFQSRAQQLLETTKQGIKDKLKPVASNPDGF